MAVPPASNRLAPGALGEKALCSSYPASSTAEAAFQRSGFHTAEVDGRLWVFRQGSPELAGFEQHGEPAEHITLIGAGPHGRTIKAPDRATIDEYLAQRPGFFVRVDDGRLWVFRDGSAELDEFRQHGEPAKCVTLIGVGPGGMTVKGPDRATIQAYLDS